MSQSGPRYVVFGEHTLTFTATAAAIPTECLGVQTDSKGKTVGLRPPVQTNFERSSFWMEKHKFGMSCSIYGILWDSVSLTLSVNVSVTAKGQPRGGKVGAWTRATPSSLVPSSEGKMSQRLKSVRKGACGHWEEREEEEEEGEHVGKLGRK